MRNLKESTNYSSTSLPNLLKIAKTNSKAKEICYELFDDKKNAKAIEFLAKFIEQKNYIYTTQDDSKEEVFIYDNGIYIPNAKLSILKQIRDILGSGYNIRVGNETLRRIELDTLTDKEKFFSHNYKEEIPLQNGILNVLTKKLSPFDPQKIFFNKLPIKYNPKSTCPNIQKHLSNVLSSKEEVNVMIELFGFCLYKEYFIEKFFMFWGYGRNGKGKTLNLFEYFFGKDNCASLPLSRLKEEGFNTHNLFGKFVNLAGDLSFQDLKNTGTLKATTGRDLISSDRKFKTEIKFVNYAKHIFACNKLPKIFDSEEGFWDRPILFLFPYKFIPEAEFNSLPPLERENKRILDPHIIEKMTTEEELSGLLNIALEGLTTIRKNKEFSYAKSIENTKQNWIRLSDSFKAFCMDNIEEDFDSKIPKDILRRAFYLYRKEHKLKGTSEKAIHVSLEEEFGVEDSRIYKDGEQHYTWKGIKFRSDSKYQHLTGLPK